MSVVESQHRAHKARLARIAARAVPQAAPATRVPPVSAPPRYVIDRNYERAWAAVILGQTEHGERSRAKPSIADIQQATAQHFGLALDELLADDRAMSVARPRQVAMFLARELTNRSCAEIGDGFAGRDHSVIVHAVKRVGRLLARDRELTESVDCIRAALDDL
jgi:chromosomal replication initiation ATPase DnaA